MIESVNNNKIKEYAKLNEKKYRDLEEMYIIEGAHLVEEAKKNGCLVEAFSLGDEYTKVSYDVMKKLSNLTTPPKILGIARKKETSEIKGNILILDGIQDPGNLGTIIRSCVAFGINTIVASLDTVDVYNTKVLRATEGMFYSINYIKCDIENFIDKIKDEYDIYTTNVNGGVDIKDIKLEKKYAIIMGNEGNGVKSSVEEKINNKIYIPMSNLCESLNVAVATSIILYEFSKK